MNPTLLLTAALLLAPAEGQQVTKKTKKAHAAGQAAPKAARPEEAQALLKEATVVRKAECVLVLKGMHQRETLLPSAGGGAPSPKHITEQFSYELPGRLEEEVDPNGSVRFRFIPATDLKGNAQAKGKLTLVDDLPGPGLAPVQAEAAELHSASPFIFEARRRGQGLIPVKGQVDLRGRIKSAAPMANPAALGPDVRPLLSKPLPTLATVAGRPGTPSVVWQGLSPWAWANTPGPMTVSGTLSYAGPSDVGRVSGSVEISLRIAARENP